MAAKLHVSPDLALPVDVVTETFWFVAKRGAGKTHAASVLVEEMLKAKAQVVVIDPASHWWGLRSSADGKGPGLPIAIFGGSHGDIPLEPSAGAYMADLVVGERVSAIFDVKVWSKGERKRFVADFAERLLSRNSEPVHIVVEEAHTFIPQRAIKGEERMKGAMESLVLMGRGSGIGSTLISQRSAHIDKNVSTQTEILVAMRTPAKHDRDAIEDWFDAHEPDQVKAVIHELPSLPTGEAWLSAPYVTGTLERIRFRPRETFDSSATPKVGEARREARTFADIDLAAIKDQMQEAIERAKADDPAELRRRIKALEAQLRDKVNRVPSTVPAPPPPRLVEIPVVDDKVLEALAELADQLRTPVGELEEALSRAHQLVRAARQVRSELESAPDDTLPRRSSRGPVGPAVKAGRREQGRGASPRAAGSTSPRGTQPPAPATDGALTKAQRALLTVLAQYGDEGRPQSPLALQAGYKPAKSTVRNAISGLRAKGYVEGAADRLVATPAGLEVLGEWEPLPQGDALVAWWQSQLGEGAPRALFDYLVSIYPRAATKEELGEATGLDPSVSTMRNALSRLRSFGLVDGGAEVRAAESLFA